MNNMKERLSEIFFQVSAGKVTSGGWGLQALEGCRPGANLFSQLQCVPGAQGSAGSKACAYTQNLPAVANVLTPNEAWQAVWWRLLSSGWRSPWRLLVGKSFTFSCRLLAVAVVPAGHLWAPRTLTWWGFLHQSLGTKSKCQSQFTWDTLASGQWA